MAALDNGIGYKGVAYGISANAVYAWGACYNQWDPVGYRWYRVCDHGSATDGVDAFRWVSRSAKVLSINIVQWY